MASTTPSMAGSEDLGNSIYLYKPSTTTPTLTATTQNTSKTTDPRLIILFTWLGGASPSRIQKYIVKHQTLFPSSTILVIRTTLADFIFRSSAQIISRLAPARAAIASTLSSSSDDDQSNPPTVLLHVMSNGGANLAVHLARSMRVAGLSFPVSGVILDCCPGTDEFGRIYRGAAYSIPEGPVTQAVGRLGLLGLVATVMSLQWTGMVTSAEAMRRDLLDPRVFGTEVRRLCLCSRADRVVGYEGVKRHIEEARGKGFEVEEAVFEKAGHCALLLEDARRYGEEIRAFWDRGVDGDRKRESVPLRSKL